MIKKIYVLLLTLVLCLFISGCKSPQITLYEKEIELAVGDIYFLNPVVTNGSGEFEYTVEDENIVSTNDNNIIALQEGTTTVTVSLKNNSNVTATLIVNVIGEATITIEGPEIVYMGGEIQLKAIITGSKEEVVWSSLNEDVASVDSSGKVKGIKLGKATIAVECGNLYAEFSLIVKRMPEIIINGDDEVVVEGTTKLSASLRNLQGTVEWSSSDESIATIDKEGNIKGIKEGKVTITAKCQEFSETKEINVVVASIEITGSKTVYVGESIQLQARVKGLSNSSDISFTWSSNLDSIATVNGGKVSGLQEGSVTITASWNGLQANYDMEVILRREVNIEGPNKVDLNDTIKLTANTLNVKGDVEWSSSDTSVATVDEKGIVSGKKIGSATITATVEGISGTYEIKVISVTDKVTYYFEGGSSKELYASEKAKAAFDITSYNNNSGSFWSGGYSSNVYLTDSSNDPTATFSDRIYIGENEYTGYYEIKGILTSGGSSWFDGAKYVISISTSYHSYRSIHNQILNLKVGDVVIIYTDDVTKIDSKNTCRVGFYGTELKGETVVFQKGEFNETLIKPVRLGYDFEGWYDASGNKVDSLTNDQISGNVKLFAKWKQLNPVTEIKINDVPLEMETDESFKINASVSPSDAFFKQVLFYTSDEDIISVTEDGLLKAINTGKATITVTDFIGEIKKTYEITVNAIASLDVKFPSDYKGILEVNETLQLEPSYLGKEVDNLSYSYSSSDNKVATVDGNGLIKAINNGTAEITIKSSNGKELVIGVCVQGLSAIDKIDQLISLISYYAIPEVEVGNACLYNDGTTRYYQATYGSVNYYLFQDFKVNNKYQAQTISTGSHSGTRPLESIEFVTVHDTATLTGTGDSMAKGLSTSGSVSIHYVVGNGEAFGMLPENYIAWHAGDGTGVKFQWLPTGIKGDEELTKEDFDMVKEGAKYYFTIKGQKTKVECPVSNGNRTIQNPSKAHFSSLGPTWTIKNGEYYIGTPWASFGQNVNGVISSHGGNNNSVGIEMCVNAGADIYTSYQVNAQLVADILIRNGLDLTRVKQHNTFDGKNCPQVLLAGNYWTEFMKMVEINYILQKDYSDAKFTLQSDNPDIIDNTGKVINPPAVATTVGYTVTVTLGSQSKSIRLYTVVPGTTSWQKWNGIYPSSLIWNNGTFVVNK